MEIKFKPMTEEQCKDKEIDQGWYKFSVKSINKRISASGDDQLVLVLQIIFEGDEYEILDWITFKDGNKMCASHIRRFCETCGLISQHDSGSLTIEMIPGLIGNVYITKKMGGQKQDGTKYEDRMGVSKYMGLSEVGKIDIRNEEDFKKWMEIKSTEAEKVDLGDDIPF